MQLAASAGSLGFKPPSAAATAAAKSLQPCPTLCDPIDSSPPGPAVPGILQARTSRLLKREREGVSGSPTSIPWGRGQGPNLDEMVGWHHRLNGHEFEQVPGVGDGEGSLAAVVHGVTKSRTRLSTDMEDANASGV